MRITKRFLFKYGLLVFLVFFSYLFVFSLYVTIWKWTFCFYSEFGHWVCFAVLSWIYGWGIAILAIMDELSQYFLKAIGRKRVPDILDVLRNLGGVGIGLVLRHFFDIKIWRKR